MKRAGNLDIKIWKANRIPARLFNLELLVYIVDFEIWRYRGIKFCTSSNSDQIVFILELIVIEC